MTARNSQGTFGTYEAVCLASIFLITKIFYMSISIIIGIKGTAAWYGTIISCTVSLILFSLISLLMKRFPNMDFAQIFEVVAGKFAGKVLILLFSVYFIFYAVL